MPDAKIISLFIQISFSKSFLSGPSERLGIKSFFGMRFLAEAIFSLHSFMPKTHPYKYMPCHGNSICDLCK